tara:strand:- start:522 stop:1478 length:957 start_codon:yes stop_codon:yes gene_type:complete
MTSNIIKKNLPKFKYSKILCIGDIILDKYVYGNVERISPEASIPILLQNQEIYQLGGMANVARNIASVGGKVTILSMMGQDDRSKITQKLIKKAKNISTYFVKTSKYRVPEKTRFVSKTNQLLRLDIENTNFLTSQIENIFLKKFWKIINKFEIVIISDYQKGLLRKKSLRLIIEYCKSKNIKVLIDPKGHDFTLYKDSYLITPNLKELSSAIGQEIVNEKDLFKFGLTVLKQINLDYLVVTRSDEGITVFSKKNVKNFPSQVKEVFDVSGAGDTVIAFIALGLSSKLSIEASVKMANHAASIVVGKRGTAVVLKSDI